MSTVDNSDNNWITMMDYGKTFLGRENRYGFDHRFRQSTNVSHLETDHQQTIL